jgi:hypothetical protein
LGSELYNHMYETLIHKSPDNLSIYSENYMCQVGQNVNFGKLIWLPSDWEDFLEN